MKTISTTTPQELKKMVFTLRAEEVAFTAIGIYLLSMHNLGLPVWLWIPLFLSPDISMLGYLVNTSVGAFSYNLFHHRAIAILLAVLGLYLHVDVLATIGILLFVHSSFDRMMGYGLKYSDDFKHTHLGGIRQK